MPKVPSKATLKILERAFAAEIEGRLPFQCRSKLAKELVESGHLQEMVRRFGTGALAVKVAGYSLTHLGRILYCETCGPILEDDGQ